MRTRSFLLITSACSAMALFLAGFDSLRGQSPTAATLRGHVNSQEEGPMEGVLVSAKKADSTISVTVVSDEQGRYQFPAGTCCKSCSSLR